MILENYISPHKLPAGRCPCSECTKNGGEWSSWYNAREKFASAEDELIREASFEQMLSLVTPDNPPPARSQHRKSAVPVRKRPWPSAGSYEAARLAHDLLFWLVALVIAVCVLTVSII